jgi:hypothetical protein
MKEKFSSNVLGGVGSGLVAIGLLGATIQPFNRCLFPREEGLVLVCLDTMPFYILIILVGLALVGATTISTVAHRLAG